MKKISALFSLIFVAPAFAETVSDFTNMCGVNGYRRLYAVPKSFTCSAGYFLPASSSTCAPCPDGYTCPGGTFEANTVNAVGLVIDNDNPYISYDIKNTCAANTGHRMNGFFSPNVHNCNPGYYLPANVDSCTICPQNSYCTGGTYTFNETTNQGIEQCTNGNAPAGSSICYGHILHIGDDMVYLKSTKLTTPSLNVGMDDGIFYANMTTTPTPMNAGTERYLKIEYDGTVYYVCDDSTYTR